MPPVPPNPPNPFPILGPFVPVAQHFQCQEATPEGEQQTENPSRRKLTKEFDKKKVKKTSSQVESSSDHHLLIKLFWSQLIICPLSALCPTVQDLRQASQAAEELPEKRSTLDASKW